MDVLMISQVHGTEKIEPLQTFEDMELNEILMTNIARLGYKKPTPIQKYCPRAIFKGVDLMACAQTGSGKTVSWCND